jgi:peptidoglycan/LPS O-acetylase OafA/YrhL
VVEVRERARPTGDRLAVLDGLRFVAAFAVVLFHFTARKSLAWPEGTQAVFPVLSRFTLYGGFGPYLFFMISGFVVLMSAWGRPVHAFLASRVGRLFPAYWLAVLLTAAVLFFNQDVTDRWHWLRVPGVAMNLTMVHSAFGVGHVDEVYWTLWVELKFYLLLTVMVLFGITRARLLALCVVWPVLGALAAQSGTGILVALLEPTYAPFFCIGILVYLVHREGWSISAGGLLGLNFCFALWTCSSYYIPWSATYAGASVSFRGLAVLLTVSVAALMVATLTRVSRITWRWLTPLGAITYPLYLIHEESGWVLLSRLRSVLPPYAAVFLVVVLMVAAAYLVHRFVERPLGPRLRRAVERDLSRAGLPEGGHMARHERSEERRPDRQLPRPRAAVRLDDTTVLVPGRPDDAEVLHRGSLVTGGR